LFGMSQDVRAKLKEGSKEGSKGDFVGYSFFGSVFANRLHKLFYQPLGIPYEYWIDNLPLVCWMEYPDKHLPELVPSAFNSRGSPSYGSIDDIMEYF